MKIRRPDEKTLISILAVLVVVTSGFASFSSEGSINGLRSLGYSLVPAAQKVELTGREVSVDSTWGVEPQVDPGEIAVRRLREGALELHNLRLEGTGPGPHRPSRGPGNGAGSPAADFG